MISNRFLLGTTALAASLGAGVSHAQTINGGGSTLASPTYEAEFGFYANSNPAADLSTDYVPSGSGQAITSVITNAPFAAGGPLPVEFGASDATITDTNLTTWNGGNKAVDGLLIQIPSFGTPITVPYNMPGVTGNGGINLTDAQLCGVFSGKITKTNDPLLSGSGIPATGNTLMVAYRGDNSGTSFLFTQHLASGVCNSGNSNLTFTATQSFASLFPLAPGSTTMHAVPANFVAGTGSPGVQGNVNTTSYSVGYLSPDYTLEVTAPQGGTAKANSVAFVNGIAPTPANTASALSTGTPAVGSSGKTFDTNYPVSFVPVAANPTAGYPIVGYTTFVLPQCFADPTVAATLKSFVSDLYRTSGFEALIRNNGFTPLPSSLSTTIVGDYLIAGTGSTLINGTGTGGCASLAGR